MANWKVWIATAVVLGTAAANAADPQPADRAVDTAKAMLDRMDRNVDGKISFEEYRNAMIRRFGARDALRRTSRTTIRSEYAARRQPACISENAHRLRLLNHAC